MFKFCGKLCDQDNHESRFEIKQSRHRYTQISEYQQARRVYQNLKRNKDWLEETKYVYTVQNGKGIYFGKLKNKKPHGLARLLNNDGSFYEGKFNQGVAEDSSALYIYPDGSYYEGTISNNQANEKGKYVFYNNLIYEGGWKNDLPHGLGKQISELGIYNGNFVDGIKQGQGTFVWKNQNVYKGQFNKGMMEGKGTFYSQKDGYKYQGQWSNNLRSGQGKQSYSDGTIISSLFQRGNRTNNIILTQGSKRQVKGKQIQGRFVSDN